MAQETYTKDQFWAELGALGEEEVRVRIATKHYGTVGDRVSLAREWLRMQEESRIEADNAEQRRTARSAKNAAWTAAIAAIIAAICAIVSIAISR